jgi:alkylation response protein AidB-like acyl-CoA dehydrogenase
VAPPADPTGKASAEQSHHSQDLVQAARTVAATTLAPRAEETDRADRVPVENLDALADAGLFCLAGAQPGDVRGSTPPAVVRAVHEALAGACGATFFVWAQHHTPVRLLGRSENAALRKRWLDPLCSGRSLGGVAFAYLRWEGRAAVRAEPVANGYRVSGTAPWVTSWGLADVFAVAAHLPGQQVMWFLVDGLATEALRPSPPLALSAMQSTSTVTLDFDGLFVPSDDVMLVETLEAWRQQDRITTSQPSPAALGVASTSCRLLSEQAARAGSAMLTEASDALTADVDHSRRHAYGLADERLPDSGAQLLAHLDRMVEARVWNLATAQRASQALVTAVGGGAIARAHPAQRLVREASFYAVQAQTAPIRAACLRRLAGVSPRST